MRTSRALLAATAVIGFSSTSLTAVTGPSIGPTISSGTVVRAEATLPTVRIADVRLEAPPEHTPEPASVLKFEMLNDGERRVTDVMIEIAIREKVDDLTVTPRTIVGPFMVAGHATIDAGYTVDYQLLLKNLPAECSCLASVRVVSARELPEP